MKKGSIRLKITGWFTAALLLVVLFTFFIIFSANHRILQKTIRDSLIETVEHNVDEIEYYSNIDAFDLLHESDHFIRYGDGYLEVDDDFLDAVNEVYTALYQPDGTMLYGENPIAAETGALSFTDSLIRTVKKKGTVYYLFDRRLEAEGVEGLWLRGVVSGKQGGCADVCGDASIPDFSATSGAGGIGGRIPDRRAYAAAHPTDFRYSSSDRTKRGFDPAH